MRCPRCDSPLDEAAVCCPACGAPLQLADEPALPRLDRTLDLDRRSSRTPVPASKPARGDLGDLSFDAPADDGPWMLSAAPHGGDEPALGPDPAVDAEEAQPRLDGSIRAPEWSDPGLELGAALPEDDADADLDTIAEDDDAEPPGSPSEHVAVWRGRVLSLASLAVAGAAALVAVLSSR